MLRETHAYSYLPVRDKPTPDNTDIRHSDKADVIPFLQGFNGIDGLLVIFFQIKFVSGHLNIPIHRLFPRPGMNPHSEVPALCIYPCSENHSEAWCNCGIRAYTLYKYVFRNSTGSLSGSIDSRMERDSCVSPEKRR